jgi:molecular chaperone GrpE
LNENNKDNQTPLSEYDKENAMQQDGDAVIGEIKDEITRETQEKPKDQNGAGNKLAQLEKALEKAEIERDSFKDSYQRTFSDFNNYKKRNQAAVSQAIKTGVCDVIEKILPVLDNLERALSHVDDKQEDPMAQGVSMVYKQLLDIMSGLGVKEIPALGEAFDPNLHQAVQQAEAEDGQEENTVVTVVQKGYMLDDRIIRHSMVIVSK